jgi:hypothetical protein
VDWKLVAGFTYRVLEFALVFCILPVLAILLLFGRIGNHAPARVRNGRIEFPPCLIAFWSWLLVIAFLVQAAVRHLLRNQYGPWDLLIEGILAAGALAFLSMLPGTIVVTDEGVEQIFWFRKNKRLLWDDIEEVSTGKEQRTVSIQGRDGTKILHTGQQVDCPRLLLELKQRCGEDLPPDLPPGRLGKR